MKKIFFLFAVLLLTVSCNRSESVITEAIDIANKNCPMEVDFATTLDRVEYDSGRKTIFYHYTVNEDYIPMTVLDESLDKIAENAVSAMKLPQSKPLIDACKDADVEIQFLYRGDQSSRSSSITYTPSTDKTTIQNLNS